MMEEIEYTKRLIEKYGNKKDGLKLRKARYQLWQYQMCRLAEKFDYYEYSGD